MFATRDFAVAILLDTSGHLLLQLRDNIPNILYPGKIGLFGGHREENENFLECIVREVHEELSYYIPQNVSSVRLIRTNQILMCQEGTCT
jgi:8-oxo-dGTP diphosphatase